MNIKKLFPEKDTSKKGFVEFLDRKGFYIVLILCIAIVGATAVFVATHNMNTASVKPDTDKIIPEEAVGNSVTDKPSVQSSISSETGKGSLKVSEGTSNGAKSSTGKNESKQTAQAKSSGNTSASSSSSGGTANLKSTDSGKTKSFIMPVFGDVITAFAQSNLVYSKTLEEWRTHSGTDIAAERGTPVKAVADGFVSDIKNDPALGIMVIIDHQNGLKTVYANLASDDMVSVNQKIKQSDVIGCVGNTASFEVADQSHLHFEVWKNNQPMNPADYLPKKSTN